MALPLDLLVKTIKVCEHMGLLEFETMLIFSTYVMLYYCGFQWALHPHPPPHHMDL